MPWNVMHEVEKEDGESVEALYKKDGKVVEFKTFEEAETFVDNIPSKDSNWYWTVSSEPINREDYFTQPAESIRVIESGEKKDEVKP